MTFVFRRAVSLTYTPRRVLFASATRIWEAVYAKLEVPWSPVDAGNDPADLPSGVIQAATGYQLPRERPPRRHAAAQGCAARDGACGGRVACCDAPPLAPVLPLTGKGGKGKGGGRPSGGGGREGAAAETSGPIDIWSTFHKVTTYCLLTSVLAEPE
jgi:hypothetical protein